MGTNISQNPQNHQLAVSLHKVDPNLEWTQTNLHKNNKTSTIQEITKSNLTPLPNVYYTLTISY